MRTRYQVQFEQRLSSATAINNYEYLDILDRAWSASGRAAPQGGALCDIGCASFWYAATLQAVFRPRHMVGIDVEGHRLLRNGHTRIDYATGYLTGLPNARFLVADYRRCELPADVITAWFPFVTPAALLAWRLPLSLLAPAELFQRVQRNLRAGGIFLMVNHGPREAKTAAELCDAAGLECQFRMADEGVLSRHRPCPAIVSAWASD